MPFKAEIFTSVIVVLGDFNPAIFTPDWFERNNLIGEGDATVAREGGTGKQPLISRQVSNFETEWFTLQVLDSQLSLTSRNVLNPAFKDLTVGIFQLLSQTPVRAIGLNFIGHFKFNTMENLHKVGDTFAPKNIWNTLYPDNFYTGLEKLTIRIQNGSRESGPVNNDEKRITLERSNNFKYGIALSINDHHDLTRDDDNSTPAERLVSIVEGQWESVWHDAERVFDKLLSMTLMESE